MLLFHGFLHDLYIRQLAELLLRAGPVLKITSLKLIMPLVPHQHVSGVNKHVAIKKIEASGAKRGNYLWPCLERYQRREGIRFVCR